MKSRSPDTHDIGELEPYELQAVVDFFIYRMSLEDRQRMMRELPSAYNKLMGSEIVKVVLVNP